MLNIHWKDWCWSWNSNNLATWCEELTHWKRPWGWETLKVGGEGDDRGWDGWIASLTQWTWVWTSFRIHREAWCATVHGVTKRWTQLSNWTELNWFCLMTWGRVSISGLILVIYPNWHHQPVMSRWDHSHLASSFIYLFLNTLASRPHFMYIPWWFSRSRPCPFYSENLLWGLQGLCKVDSVWLDF